MGNVRLALFLAFKSVIKGNRWTLLLIIAVMSLSFTNLLLTPSILAGMTNTLNRQQIDTVLGNIVVGPPADKYYLDKAGLMEEKIEQIPGVAGVASHLGSSALIEYKWKEKESTADRGISGTWNVVGIEPSRETGVTTIHEHMLRGSYLSDDDRDKIVLGIEIAGGATAHTADFLTLGGARVGDKVRLTYSNGVQREYTVKGIFQAKEMIQADRLAFVTMTEMSSILGRDVFHDRATQILVKIEREGEEKRLIGEIKSCVGDGEVRGWSAYGAISGIISSFDVIASLIGGIGLIVAGIVMFIVIYINVMNRKRQIGILRAIGIKRKVIVGAYLSQSLFYAVSGVVLGGSVFGYVIQPYFARHPLELPLGQLSLVVDALTVDKAVLGILVAAVLAGLLPVLSITRQSIIYAIWGN